MKYYDPSSELVFMGSTGPVRSAQVLKDYYDKKSKKGNGDFGKLTFSDLEVEELAPGIARAWGKWLVEQKDQKLSGGMVLVNLEKDTCRVADNPRSLKLDIFAKI